jgi:DNA-binding MarR family transcriptional regulator
MTIKEPVTTHLLQETIETFWETVPPVWNHIRGNVQEIAMQNFNITVEQFHVLRLIRKGKDSVSSLADQKKISRSAISQAVDTLVDKGLISRQPDEHDRRVVHLLLTASGDDLLNQIFQKNRAWMADKMSALDVDMLLKVSQVFELLKTTFADDQK